jgi:hypothetical protein
MITGVERVWSLPKAVIVTTDFGPINSATGHVTAVVWQISLPLTVTRYPVIWEVDGVQVIELLLIEVGAKFCATGGEGFTTILFKTTVSMPSTVAAKGTIRTPVKPLTGVTEMPIVVAVIITRDLNSSITSPDSEIFLAATLRFAD